MWLTSQVCWQFYCCQGGQLAAFQNIRGARAFGVRLRSVADSPLSLTERVRKFIGFYFALRLPLQH